MYYELFLFLPTGPGGPGFDTEGETSYLKKFSGITAGSPLSPFGP